MGHGLWRAPRGPGVVPVSLTSGMYQLLQQPGGLFAGASRGPGFICPAPRSTCCFLFAPHGCPAAVTELSETRIVQCRDPMVAHGRCCGAGTESFFYIWDRFMCAPGESEYRPVSAVRSSSACGESPVEPPRRRSDMYL
ncbi:hypothetical protein RRG08_043742 [Elysia crispata]|uniref:Uncharacterized protein n=1 Tax=Elysia crispata TaxID=231223 RepID=A0AAE0ZQ31_9GAST|nr:hypothetical protein RRG08_043742 [Elysia crispata]